MAPASTKHICHIVPNYLLKAIAECDHNDEEERTCAHHSMEVSDHIVAKRVERLQALTAPRGLRLTLEHLNQHQSIVPDILLRQIAESEEVDEETRVCARRDLEHIKHVQERYQATQGLSVPSAEGAEVQIALAGKKKTQEPGKTYRAIYDAKNSSNENALPGTLVRAEGQPPVEDAVVNEAFDNAGKVLEFYEKMFNWKSIDNRNMQVISSVHFGKNYENAFWDPERLQMVYGDGGKFLWQFTKCIDVIGHELTHAVTEHTSPLDYYGQSGALNEHISDVFGIMVKQMVEDEPADKADWLIGEGCLLPDIKGVSLRSMKDPGNAYNDPRFGKDPQPDHFKHYKTTWEDNGGVHLYSGIPNKAFYLASVAFGGYSWEKAGKIWWETMNSGQIPPKCTFIQFADVTVEKAEELFGEDAAKIVRDAWSQVGVVRKV